jgi:hypothetical protein
MQFKVPQFIDIEDKLFGPFTFHQFAYLAGGASIVFVIFKLLPLWLGLIPMLFVAGLALLLTFYKINNKPFIYYLQAGIVYAFGSKLYVWKQRVIKHDPTIDDADKDIPDKISVVPMTSQNSLKDLSWNLDVQDNNQ